MSNDDHSLDTATGGCPIGTGTSGPSPTGPVGSDPGSENVRPDAVRLLGSTFQQDPVETYRQMRWQHGPVVPVALEDDMPAWLVIGYREVHEVLDNPQLFARDPRRWNALDRMPEGWGLRPFVSYYPCFMFTEGAEHQRRAGAISDALAGVDQFELGSLCERIADDVLNDFAADGKADLIAQYAERIPLLVLAKLFGLPDSEAGELVRDMSATVEGGEAAVDGQMRLLATMQRLLQEKRQRPGSDIPSRLLAHPEGFGAEELIPDLLIVLTAAQQPTTCWIGNTLRLMLTDSHFAVNLSGGRRSVAQSLNEVLWEDTPTQNYLGRFAARGTQLGGQHIRAGDLVLFSLAGANADPRVRPDSYEGSHGNNAHLSFSYGEHRCPYPAPELAEIITKTAVEVLLDRLPDVDLAVEPEELVWRPSVLMRGLSALPVTFTPS